MTERWLPQLWALFLLAGKTAYEIAHTALISTFIHAAPKLSQEQSRIDV